VIWGEESKGSVDARSPWRGKKSEKRGKLSITKETFRRKKGGPSSGGKTLLVRQLREEDKENHAKQNEKKKWRGVLKPHKVPRQQKGGNREANGAFFKLWKKSKKKRECLGPGEKAGWKILNTGQHGRGKREGDYYI